MRSLQIGAYDRQVATTYNELTGRQLLALVRLRQRPTPSTSDELLQLLVGVPRRTFAQLNLVQRVELRPLVRFLQADLVDVAPLTAQLLPVLRLGKRAYYGPGDALRTLRFDEFIFADTYYLRYLQTGEAKFLDQLVAVLYRPERADSDPSAVTYQGDRREDFNEHLVPARARALAALLAHGKQAVLLYYRGCRRLLEQRYEYVFTESTTTQATASGWQDVLHELAGGVAHLEATAGQRLHNVLREMNRVLRQAEERAEAARH